MSLRYAKVTVSRSSIAARMRQGERTERSPQFINTDEQVHGNTEQDQVSYLQFLSKTARDNGLLIDLKNAGSLLQGAYKQDILDAFDFSVVEQCVSPVSSLLPLSPSLPHSPLTSLPTTRTRLHDSWDRGITEMTLTTARVRRMRRLRPLPRRRQARLRDRVLLDGLLSLA